MSKFDPIQVEVWRHLFASIAEEMGATLERTGYSPNIKERRDYSCALFDAKGRLLAQAAHIPVHLGAMPMMMERLRDTVEWRPGAMWLCNDPSHGGTHLPDLTMVAPVYSVGSEQSAAGSEIPPDIRHPLPQTLIGFVANRAHHADIGGMSPGSLPLSTELIQEGLIIPPVRYVSGNRVNTDIRNLVCANSRTPNERRGDLAAQVSANRTGIQRLVDLVDAYGLEEVNHRAKEARLYAASVVRAVIERAPDGVYRYEDRLDDDGLGNEDLPIVVTVTIRGGRIAFDFTGTAPETAGPMNAPGAVTRSACYYVVRCLVDEEIPMNDGAFDSIDVIAPEGTLVNARGTRAVSAGNVTSQRITDTLLGALAQVFPDRIPAASQGTMNNLLIGGFDTVRGGPFAYYETICGGAGGSAVRSGASAVHTHMTNTRNTPIEALEMHYPLRIREYSIREGSGGPGANRGGDGVIRSIELLSPAHVSVISERRRYRPPGSAGGEWGAAGRNSMVLPNGTLSDLPGKVTNACEPGTVITIETPGGGGHGSAR